ncbi:MAG: carbohydrate kinase family protein [Kiritimatiellae bacterium]|nr:carbohydrate kinase family protein [Verrucomicrobiota bacterium]MCG2659458.1 carbohydrate kinase family protein [Kiritimatiellia bacterium]
MSKEFDVMVAGHLCCDIIPCFPDTGARSLSEILRPGKLVHVEEAAISTGGPVSNTGIALKKLGNRVCFCARIGNDDFGRLIQDRLKACGSAEGIKVAAESGSSYTVVLAPPGIDRIFLHNPGANDTFSSEDLSPQLIAKCRHFHFGYPPLMRRMFEQEGRELQRVFEIAKQAGATTSCDMALPDPASPSGRAPWKKILAKILPYVDIYLPSVEESFFMLEPERFMEMKKAHGGADLINYLSPLDYSRIADQLLALGTKMTALKTGHRGYYFKTRSQDCFNGMGAARPGRPEQWASRELWCPAFVCNPLASATGSGDSSIAGFLAAFLKGLSPEASLKTAICLGWQNLQALDAVSSIRSWDETQSAIKEDLPLIPFPFDAPGWKWDASLKLWVGPGNSL